MSDFKDLITLLRQTSDKELLEDLLLGITTDKERAELGQRLEIVKRLIAGQPQHKIASELGVGIATVTRGSKELSQGRFKVLRRRSVKTTGTILDEIVAAKKAYVQQQKLKKPQAELEQSLVSMPPPQGQGFFEALKVDQPRLKIIAEVKKASPSSGLLRDPFVLADINKAYQEADNVAAISVITERDFFGGSEETLTYFAANNINHKPLLRKDFIFDPYQVIESKLLGAQAYLLIASLFELRELQELVDCGLKIGIEPLVEVHNQEELAMARQTAARCIGVNSRALSDFSLDVSLHELLKKLPNTYVRIAESGLDNPKHLEAVATFADAALVGSYFMRAPNIAVAIKSLVKGEVKI